MEKLTKRQKYLSYQRKNREKLTEDRRNSGLCLSCGRPCNDSRFVTCSFCRDKKKVKGRQNHNSGLCNCGRQRVPNFTRCEDCLNNLRLIRQERRTLGLCSCGKQPEPGKLSCDTCIKRSIKRGKLLRQEVIAAYGGFCVCCGENVVELLEIDHKNNNGAIERQNGLKGSSFYTWLKENNYPKDSYQCLCCSCNIGKHRCGGVCPHKLQPKEPFTWVG